MTTPFFMNSYLGKQILALVREGDFAHAGEEDAIALAMAAVPQDPDQQVLDAGCGRGGTAAYMQKNGWGRVTGIDIEPKSIDYANQAYPDARFYCCDIGEVAMGVDGAFDVITLFNVLYALPDHGTALGALASRARENARLVIFDYVDPGRYQDAPLMDASRPFLPNPTRLADIAMTLEQGGWKLKAVKDLNEDYAQWYARLVAKIAAKREAIEAMAGAEIYEHVLGLYSALHQAILEGRLGGAVIHGEKPAGEAAGSAARVPTTGTR